MLTLVPVEFVLIPVELALMSVPLERVLMTTERRFVLYHPSLHHSSTFHWWNLSIPLILLMTTSTAAAVKDELEKGKEG